MKMMKRITAPALLLAAMAGGGDAAAQASRSGQAGALIDEMATTAKKSGGAVQIREAAVPVGETQAAWKAHCAGQKDIGSPVVEWAYKRTEVRCLRVREKMFTTILLPPGDTVVDWNLGDNTAFETVQPPARPNVLLVRPKGGMVDVDTQLTITGRSAAAPANRAENFADGAAWSRRDGGRNVYTFYLQSMGTAAVSLPNVTVFVTEAAEEGLPPGVFRGGDPFAGMPRTPVEIGRPDGAGSAQPAGGDRPEPGSSYNSRIVGETYVEDRPKEPGPAIVEKERGDEAPEYLREIPFRMSELSFSGYRIMAQDEESLSIAPERVMHDGRFTYIDFGEGVRADRILRPIVKEVVDGIESNVNTRTTGPAGNILLVEAVGTLVLRNGARVVCLVFNDKDGPPAAAKVGKASEARRPAPGSSPGTAVKDGVPAVASSRYAE